MKESLVKLEGITKSYDGQMILDDLNLDIYQNSFVTLLGPSGCGKTTTLRIIGGFETPDKGKVIFDGQDITSLPPHKRALNTVFQKYALFPNMTIMVNYYGQSLRRYPFLLPFYWIRLNISRLLHLNKESKTIINNMNSISEKDLSETKRIMDICGL